MNAQVNRGQLGEGESSQGYPYWFNAGGVNDTPALTNLTNLTNLTLGGRWSGTSVDQTLYPSS